MPRDKTFSDAETELVVRDRLARGLGVEHDAVLAALRLRYDRPGGSPRPEILQSQIEDAVAAVEYERRVERLKVLDEAIESRLRAGAEEVRETVRDLVAEEIVRAKAASQRVQDENDEELKRMRAEKRSAEERAKALQERVKALEDERDATRAATEEQTEVNLRTIRERDEAVQACKDEAIRSESLERIIERYIGPGRIDEVDRAFLAPLKDGKATGGRPEAGPSPRPDGAARPDGSGGSGQADKTSAAA